MEQVSHADLSVREWSRQKEIYSNKPEDSFEFGFATFYLNRTNRSGVLNGGPIGGMDQSGNYKIDARFNRPALCERIRVIGLHASKIKVTNYDGARVIRKYAPQADALIYADPPYFDKAGSLYLNSFEAADHSALASCLNDYHDSRWVLTYDDVPQVGELYQDRRSRLFSLNYSAHRVVKAQEIMIFSDGLKIPQELETEGLI
jgi:DNA adenine methylase